MSATQPNVLLICVDHWPGRLLGCAGHPAISTPTLDQLARNGVRFPNAYSATPVCVPARKALFTGLTAKSHGDRVFDDRIPVKRPTIADCFVRAGYQAQAVGKMHVYPPRDRHGFQEVILHEEGRHVPGMGADDYELELAECGYPGREFTHGMGNNHYWVRPWHLPEELHWTNWEAHHLCRTIRRRDPTRPSFWYLSFNHPHPPLVPLAAYLEMYRRVPVPDPVVGAWARDHDRLPVALRLRRDLHPPLRPFEMLEARRAFYALCTHIDHQLRLVIGTLREERLLDDTIILFTADHGDLLGNHRLFAKGLFYEDSAKVPMILVPAANDKRVGHHRVDDRLVELRDVYPTLLDLAGIPVPETVEGLSMVGNQTRPDLYGEYQAGIGATRMIRDQRYKLIWYPVGNRLQLFDLDRDPDECRDLAGQKSLAPVRQRLAARLVEHLYGEDAAWVKNGRLVGAPEQEPPTLNTRDLFNQRGWRFMGGGPA